MLNAQYLFIEELNAQIDGNLTCKRFSYSTASKVALPLMEMTFVVFHSSASQAAAVEEAVTGWFDMSCWTVP
jgi:hypothetical protein